MTVCPKLFTVQLIPNGKSFLAKVGKTLTEQATKDELIEKLQEIYNIISLGKADLNTIVKEDPRLLQYEDEILSEENPIVNLIYAHFFIKGRWPEAEKAISRNKDVLLAYVKFTVKERVVELEPKIKKDPELTFEYCKNVFKRKKVPLEIHNTMIAHAFTSPNNKFVKKYFKLKKNKIS